MTTGTTQKSSLAKVLWTAVHPRWNVKFRPPLGTVTRVPYALPANVDKYAAQLETDTLGGRFFTYGSAVVCDVLGDKAPDSAFQIPETRSSKEYDSYIIAPWWHPHPLFTMGLLAFGAWRRGHSQTPYKTKIMLMWKRMRINTPAGQFDLSVMPHGFDMACVALDVDLGLCSLAASRCELVIGSRHVEDAANNTLTFRPMLSADDEGRGLKNHPMRRRKYQSKFPERMVVYADAADAEHFADFDSRAAAEKPPRP